MEVKKKQTASDEMPYLKIVRQFNVVPEIIFDAFTKPDAMRVWWADDTVFDRDLRVGGRWTITREEVETI